MEQLQNFSPSDVQNGTLAQMFRNAGINDVHSYIDEVRQEDFNIPEQSIPPMTNSSQSSSNRLGAFFNKGQHGEGKSGLSNVKQMYKMCKSMDKNGDGKITVEDVEIILKELGLGFVSKHLARAIFDIVDTNHNGQLDFRDLVALASLLKRLSSSSSSSVRF